MVTGAAGFVGRHLITALRRTWPDLNIIETTVDVREPGAVALAIRHSSPSCCVHLAGIASIMQAAHHQDEAWQVNLHGSLNVARAILAHAPACQMLFAASADVYGASFRTGAALDETALLAPTSIYGATKAAADLALGCLAEQGLKLVRLRPFNHIGAGQSHDFVVASFARQIMRIRAGLQPPIMHVGRLDTYRDFLDVRDVCAAYIACLTKHGSLAPGTIINIASGQARRIGDVLDELLHIAGVECEIRVDVPRVRETDINHARGDARRAAALLGWTPQFAWRDTLADIIADWRARVAQAPDGTDASESNARS
jgi:GDP-4-dehydro-6-deoxy-D-mannose reductase